MDRIFQISEEQKEDLRDPFGKLLSEKKEIKEKIDYEIENQGKIISIGDFSSKFLEDLEIFPDFTIIDGKIERKRINPEIVERLGNDKKFKAKNPAGCITREAWKEVKIGVLCSDRAKLIIDGEEDLLALPAIYFSPLNSLVIYGLRNRGSVIVKVDKRRKKAVEKILNLNKFGEVLLGGTWDHLHLGHKFLIFSAFEHGEEVRIGITSDEMTRKNSPREKIQPFDVRKSEMKKFLKKFGLFGKCKINKIDDFMGSATERGDAIITTPENMDEVQKINRIREKNNRNPLNIIKINKIRADDGEIISSSRVRSGKIDKEGRKI